jgi:hypothetical protein
MKKQKNYLLGGNDPDGAAGHPCLVERDIAKYFDMKPFVFIQVFPFLNNI